MMEILVVTSQSVFLTHLDWTLFSQFKFRLNKIHIKKFQITIRHTEYCKSQFLTHQTLYYTFHSLLCVDNFNFFIKTHGHPPTVGSITYI